MSIQRILDRLDNVYAKGESQYRAACPSHQSKGQTLSLRELDDGRILLHCFAGCSPVDVMESIGMSIGDLFEERLADRIQPLYMARQEKQQQKQQVSEERRCELRLDMADDMRARGMMLTPKDLEDERKAFIRLRQLKGVAA